MVAAVPGLEHGEAPVVIVPMTEVVDPPGKRIWRETSHDAASLRGRPSRHGGNGRALSGEVGDALDLDEELRLHKVAADPVACRRILLEVLDPTAHAELTALKVGTFEERSLTRRFPCS